MPITLTAIAALTLAHQGQTRPPVRPPLPTTKPPIVLAPRQDPPKITLPPKKFLWGWADLHTHPASHLSFGANAQGEGGIFWGKPGLNGNSNPLADMPACNVDSHYGYDEDVVRKETRKAIIQTLDGLTGWTHGANGGASFANWPHAQSIVHQQMHISAIKRAYDGGLRLMVASVTDSQMLSNLWTKIGFNLLGNAVPAPDPQHDYECAKRQIDFIQREAAANNKWMRIVTSSAEAKKAIEENKLAVVLSLEMDSLSVSQMLDLVQNYQVRHIVPIHLVNNTFGGCAVYSDVFNASNNYLNGKFFKVNFDQNLDYRLGIPQVLRPSDMGSIKPMPISLAEFTQLGYIQGAGGHKNALGLYEDKMLALMKKGLLIDLAHMGERTTDQALVLAEKYNYPVMDSHTGIRHAGEKSHSERDLKRSHAQRIAKLGGVIGLGTEGSSAERQLLKVSGKPVVRFTGQLHDWSRSIPTANSPVESSIYNLRLTVTTGGDDLRGGNDNLDVILNLQNGQKMTFKNVNQSKGWGGGQRVTVKLPVPKSIKIGDLVSITLRTAFGGGIGGDNWNVDEVLLAATEMKNDTISQWLTECHDLLSLTGGRQIAIGTDINGFAAQIPHASGPNIYPIAAAAKYGTPPAGYVPPTLQQDKLGAKVFDFRRDGIAHFGMLADFMGALDKRGETGAKALNQLFRSAHYTVEMWEKAEQAAKNIK